MSDSTNQNHASTQHYLNIADIRDNILVLKNGELRQVLSVTALNFALKSEEEQAAIIYQYQSFLNSLQFPVQLLIQSRRLDLAGYIAELRERLQQTQSPLMRTQIADYLDFISRLISFGNIMEKHFYVVVPYADSASRSRNIINSVLRRDTVTLDEKQFASIKTKLEDRSQNLQAGLASMGLTVTPLDHDALIALLYTTYNPAEAGESQLSSSQ